MPQTPLFHLFPTCFWQYFPPRLFKFLIPISQYPLLSTRDQTLTSQDRTLESASRRLSKVKCPVSNNNSNHGNSNMWHDPLLGVDKKHIAYPGDAESQQVCFLFCVGFQFGFCSCFGFFSSSQSLDYSDANIFTNSEQG